MPTSIRHGLQVHPADRDAFALARPGGTCYPAGMNDRRGVRLTTVFLALATSLLSASPAAAAEGEISAIIGILFGGDLEALLGDEDFSISRGFENGPTYGARIGWIGYPLGVEGSVVYSPTGVQATVGDVATVDAEVLYGEVSALLIFLPGPISPFVTGGLGYHALDLSAEFDGGSVSLEGLEIRKLGYTYGGGVKANIKRLTVRVDVRDHLTRLDEGDLVPAVAEALGLEFEDSLHNVELSLGAGFRF